MSGFLKFISPLVHPFGLVWLAFLVSAFICLYRRRALGTLVCAGAAILQWFFSQAPVVEPLLLQLERPWIRNTPAQAPAADAIIVLGGGWRSSRHDFVELDLTAAGDRWMAGLELCRLKRAPTLVIGGDPPPFASAGESAVEPMRQWLQKWGLSEVKVLSLGPVRSTREEAARARELVDQRAWRKVLLVTSAHHMRRAADAFERAGVPFHPVACDFQAARGLEQQARWRPFPNEDAFLGFGLWWHEQLGWLAYRLQGHL